MSKSHVKVQAQKGHETYGAESITNSDGPVTTKEVITALEKIFETFPKKVRESDNAQEALKKAIKQARDLADYGTGSKGEGINVIHKPFTFKDEEYRLDVEVTTGEIKG